VLSGTQVHGAGPLSESVRPASEHFRFRFIARGETASQLVVSAVQSLKRCHPNIGVLLVDANDDPVFDQARLRIGGDVEVAHLPPDEDEVAQAVGRGSRRHLFYWRHSPQLLSALPKSDRFAVYSDADMVFLRPLDLTSLLAPLASGRIAAVVDESSLEFYQQLGALAATPIARMLPAGGAAGPLLQGGLLFTNPTDDGRFYERFWELAVGAARSGYLAALPWDDMCLITALLGQGGPLWERLLTLGHEWNYISDTRKDPGIFGCVAHYGGRRAQAFMLTQGKNLFPSDMEGDTSNAWGTITAPSAASGLIRGSWGRRVLPRLKVGSEPARRSWTVALPFALTWSVPIGIRRLNIAAALQGPVSGKGPDLTETAFFVYVDGRLVCRSMADAGRVRATVRFDQAETVTIIAVTHSRNSHVQLDDPFHQGLQEPAQ
jgi:hypothetical protein